MDKQKDILNIHINLLPPEFAAAQKQGEKFLLVQSISVVMLLIFIFLATVTVAIRVLQHQSFSAVQTEADSLTQKVDGFKNKESALVLLKEKLNAINSIESKPSKQSSLYYLIAQLIPADTSIGSLNIDKTGNVIFSLVSPDVNSLENLLAKLNSEEAEAQFSKVVIESLGRGRDESLRINLKVTSK